MKQVSIFIFGLIIGVLVGYFSIQTLQLYKPSIIHGTINLRPDSIKGVETEITKTIIKTKLIHDHKKDSIIHLPDSVQFDLFRANCERYNYLYSHDSAVAN